MWPGWVRILGWSYWYWGTHIQEIHFWFASFFTRKNQEIQNLHWTFLWEPSFYVQDHQAYYLFWAILCLSSHSCTTVSYYSLQLKILWFLTFKILCFLHWFKLFIHGFIAWFYAISILFAVQPPGTPTLPSETWWRPRGVRGRVDTLSAAHPTDLRPIGAFAFIGKISSQTRSRKNKTWNLNELE